MPGHKGQGELEAFDITEIKGADSLYEADGVIKESEDNASRIFGFPTYYSTEGSSQCIRAMLHLALSYAKKRGKEPVIYAVRNVHKAFVYSAALLDFKVEWLYSEKDSGYISCSICADSLEKRFIEAKELPCAVYLTSPDYLGNKADIASVANVCRKYGVLLLVDNAHGAYLKFLSESEHPIDLGAHMCCDSAHKTLPVLTGGAYLHIAEELAGEISSCDVKNAMVLFGSTSPSYVILQSLDKVNLYLNGEYKKDLSAHVKELSKVKEKLISAGYTLLGDEELKITVSAVDYGYSGLELADILDTKNIVCEFADPDYIVFMFTPQISKAELEYFTGAMLSIEKREPLEDKHPEVSVSEAKMSIREAMFAPAETVLSVESVGRIFASASVGCPPAVPIVVSGEVITPSSVKAFEYYGIKEIKVIK